MQCCRPAAPSSELYLFAWAQLAIDTGDAVLADAVLRANGKRLRDDRAFLASTFLNLIPNADYNEARDILQAVLNSARSAGIAIAEFEGRRSAVSLDLIRMGLADQDGALPTDGLDDDPFDSSGAVKPEYLLATGKKVAGQGSGRAIETLESALASPSSTLAVPNLSD